MSPMNRRRFLQTSVAAAAALSSAPHIAKAKDPNGKLGVAVVGVRGRGGDHINGFLGDARTVILYLVDPDEKEGLKRCDQVTKKQGIKPKFVRDMREAFQDPAVDLVGSATPNHWHALSAIWAMQAGKDVYVEKPVCHDIAEGTAMIAAARKYGRICQVGTQCRSHQAIQEAMKFLHAGGIGDVNLARGLCYKRRKSIGPKGDYPVPPEVDFSLWSGPAPFTTPKVTRPQFHYDWHWQRLYGNGDSGNQGPHQTDIARWGLGMDRHPSSVISYGGRLGYQAERQDDSYIDAGDTPNTEVSIFDYGDKCLVFETRGLSVDDCADEELNRLFGSNKGGKVGVVFYGSEGYLVQRTYTDCEAFDKQFKSIKQFKGGGDHYGNFIDACTSRNHQDLNADVREGHLSAALAHLGNISYYLGEANKVSADEAAKVLSGSKSRDDNRATLERTLQHLKDNGNDLAKYPISLGPLLTFDPAKEVFPDTPEATAMVRREYREGFVCPAAEKV